MAHPFGPAGFRTAWVYLHARALPRRRQSAEGMQSGGCIVLPQGTGRDIH